MGLSSYINAIPSRVNSIRWAAYAIGIIAGVAYLIQAWIYAHSQVSILDEGAYLYKGFLFVTGKYHPYQDYGVWTNHMPLSFLIPGTIQALFGPGLRTGRYFAILLSLLMLAGLWVLTNRIGGRWWAAAAVGAVALNPALIKTYSVGLSQGLIACMLVWIVVLVLGEQRSSLQIMLGALLTGLMVTTREEIVVVLPVLLIFIFWRYGIRMGLLATLAAGMPVVILYAVYWPGILRLSGTITPFLNAWQISDIGVSVWNNSLSFSDRGQSFLLGLRTGFVPLAGVIGLSPLCLWKDQWRTKLYWQAAVFLSVLFIVLLVLYGWAALGMNYCVYCFEGYLAFIAPLGLALIVVTFVGWKAEGTRWFPWYTVALVILLLTAIGYSAEQDIGPKLLDFPLPRVKGGQILSGAAPLGAILENAFGVDYRLSRWLVSAFGGLLLGIILLLIAWSIFRSRRTGVEFKRNKGLVIISVMLVTGMLLSPTVVLAGAKQDRDCSRDVIASYERIGERLAEVIAPGHSVFWEGGLSVAPLLYLPGIKIYPAQINDGYSHRVGGDIDDLRRIGLWNDEMEKQWLEEADFILIEKPRYDDEWKEFLETGRFEELQATPSYLPCRDVPLRIFRRNKLDQSED